MEIALSQNTAWTHMEIALSRITAWNQGSNLVGLNLSGLGLTTLPSLPANLMWLDCSYNQLTTLPSLPMSLCILYCNNNGLPYNTLNEYRTYKSVYRIMKWWKLWRPGPRKRANTRTVAIHDELVTVVAAGNP